MVLRPLAVLALALAAAACTSVAGQAPAPDLAVVTDVAAERWRAVLVAGDNDSPAFDNGVEAMRDKLTAQGVRDISLYSSNAARAGAGRLATVVNLQGALRAGGGEACLAFVTSHGEKDGVLLRLDRRLMAPSALDQALTEGCGSRPTVLIVSACHSGIFIDDRTRRPNRIILTAAAIDRVSFGCGAGDQYTYYDRCLLQRFDGAATWRELAAATASCVETTEGSLGIRRASQPQAFIGAAVADLRLPGR